MNDGLLFDIRPYARPMRMWRAIGVKPGKTRKKPKYDDRWICASTEQIATRVAKKEFSIYNYKLASIYPATWEEYGRAFAGCGIKIEPKRK